MSNTRTVGADRLPKTLRGRRWVAILSVIVVLITGSIVAGDIESASAKTKYPSWSDVVHARKNKAHVATEVKTITKLITHLEIRLRLTTEDATKKGDAYQAAEQDFFEADIKWNNLQKQAATAAKAAKTSETRASLLVARLARGGSDMTLSLWGDSKDATTLLSSIGQAGKVSERTNAIYEQAIQMRNSAQSLTDQAKVAKGIRESLKATAQKAFEAAQASAQAAQTAFEDNQKHAVELKAQLAALTTNLKLTEKQYLKGVRAQYGAGAGLAAGQISASGWAKPGAGPITSGFGLRFHPILHYWRLHTGTDMAAYCGAPIYAAHTGTVIYAGPYGTYGNFILIDNGGGIQTGYAHIMPGGILVHVGQGVGVGQQIAREGETGFATGCHLHYEVRRNGVAIDAVPFMRAQGIILG